VAPSRGSGRLVLLGALAWAIASPTRAQGPLLAGLYAEAGGSGGAPQPVFLDLVVNQVRREAVLVELTPDDVWAGVEDLARAGLRGFGGARRTSGGRELVSLASLAPDLALALDDAALELRITASAALLGRTGIDLAPNPRPPGAETSNVASGFANYAGRLETDGAASGALEAGLSLGLGDLLQSGVTFEPDGSAIRGLTTLTVDRPSGMLRFDAGDTVAPASGLGGGAVVLGAGVARDFSLDPYFVSSPRPSMAGFAATPSTAEVWVNGSLARREALPPGSYDLWNLPVVSGANDVRVVVRDAFGRTQAVETSPYFGPALLAPGVHQYSVHAGVRRENLGSESFDYGDFLLVARERVGLSDRITAGARLEAGPGLASGGASASLVTSLGEWEAELAASGGDGYAGAGAYGAWRLRTRRHVAAAYLRWQSPRYAHASLDPRDERTLLRAGLVGSASPLPRLGLSAELGALVNRDTGRETRLEIRASYGVAPGTAAGASVRTTFPRGGEPEVAFLATLSFAAGRGAAAELSAGAASDGSGSAVVGVSRSLPRGPGYGYSLRAASAPRSGSALALVEAQSAFGRAEASYQSAGPEERGWLAVAGGAVFLREGVFLTRPVEQGFALVEVPGVEGVTVFQENQVVGRTDADGEILVPTLAPFRANRLSIDDGEVPLDRSVAARERLLVAPRRSGAVARFPVERLSALTGRVHLSGPEGRAAPAGGMLRLGIDARVFSSPIGEDGTFWLEGIPAGAHGAEVFWRGRLCRFTVAVPEEGPAVRDLGELVCGDGPPGP
jgi:outer membrane usher protein